MSQFSFSSSVRSSMIIELVLVIPRSTGLDSKLGEPDGPRITGLWPPKCTGGQRNQATPGHLSEA
jgi:hypothetical protein